MNMRLRLSLILGPLLSIIAVYLFLDSQSVLKNGQPDPNFKEKYMLSIVWKYVYIHTNDYKKFPDSLNDLNIYEGEEIEEFLDDAYLHYYKPSMDRMTLPGDYVLLEYSIPNSGTIQMDWSGKTIFMEDNVEQGSSAN
jgi:hypothetical protein